MTEEWLDFIIDCRAGKSHSYDIVIGAMADDQIYNYISDYMDGAITRELEQLPGSSSGYWLNLNILRIRLIFVQKQL